MKLRLRDPHARFSPCRIQIPPIRIIRVPIRLLITRITALNTRCIVHLECTVKLIRAGIVCGFAILNCKYPPAEPEALRSLAPQRGLFATVESKSKNNSKSTESKARAYSRNCQTSTASPAEPGGLPIGLECRQCAYA